MTTSARWIQQIEEACVKPDQAESNRQITALHYGLSEALAEKLGRVSGPNFHTWAVWGSRKAGVTIRQEDLGSAIRNATMTAGVVGLFFGAGTGILAGRRLPVISDATAATLGAVLGVLAGSWTGRQIAISSRREAAAVVLAGNQTVLRDIGEQSARFLQLLEDGASEEERKIFFSGLRCGPTEQQGQDRLRTAFHAYLAAFDTDDSAVKREAMIAGNCEIVYHEHIRLEPYIRRAMPWIVRRCATQRLMTFEIGERMLAVGQNVPGVAGKTAARDWSKIEERMKYVFALFRQFHDEAEVFSAP